MKHLNGNGKQTGFGLQVLLHVCVSFTRFDGAYLIKAR